MLFTLAREALEGDLDPAAGSAAGSAPALTPTRLEPAREPGTPHNVVFVVLESARARSTTPYVPGLGTTPFLPRLARDGLRVGHAYTPVPHTSKALVSGSVEERERAQHAIRRLQEWKTRNIAEYRAHFEAVAAAAGAGPPAPGRVDKPEGGQ